MREGQGGIDGEGREGEWKKEKRRREESEGTGSELV